MKEKWLLKKTEAKQHEEVSKFSKFPRKVAELYIILLKYIQV